MIYRWVTIVHQVPELSNVFAIHATYPLPGVHKICLEYLKE